MRIGGSRLAVGVVALALAVAAGAEPRPVGIAVLSTQDALAAARAALQRCRDDGHAVSVAVVDRTGNLKVFLRHDQAGPHTVESAQRKAFTAASLGRSTAEYARLIQERPETRGLQFMHDRILLLGGGLPVRLGEAVVAGIGVGGAPGGQLDEACAQAGIDAITGQ